MLYQFRVAAQGEGVVIYCRLNGKKIFLAVDSWGSVVGQDTSYIWSISLADAFQYYITYILLNYSIIPLLTVLFIFFRNDSGGIYLGAPNASDSAVSCAECYIQHSPDSLSAYIQVPRLKCEATLAIHVAS